MKYEIQMLTVCDGWVNTWIVEHEDGSSEPETFDGYSAALNALIEFIEEIEEEIAIGQREPDEGYSIEEFRVWPVSVEGSA